MDFLKKLLPMSFKKTETNDLVKRIVIYAVCIILKAQRLSKCLIEIISNRKEMCYEKDLQN